MKVVWIGIRHIDAGEWFGLLVLFSLASASLVYSGDIYLKSFLVALFCFASVLFVRDGWHRFRDKINLEEDRKRLYFLIRLRDRHVREEEDKADWWKK